MTFTKAEVHILAENTAWQEILKRAQSMMDVADAKIENESLYNQGYFVAMRKMMKFLGGATEQLLAELEGKAGVVKMK